MKDDDSSWSVKQRNIEDMDGWMVTNLTDKQFSITEIMVPTCSYRMGVYNIGYGVAIISKSDNEWLLCVFIPGPKVEGDKCYTLRLRTILSNPLVYGGSGQNFKKRSAL